MFRFLPFFDSARDHPRGCGDMMNPADAPTPISGSPPRVRGHARMRMVKPAIQGITPAGAGTWKSNARQPRVPEDHPRGCGDMKAAKELQELERGSPPRVRGHANYFHHCTTSPGITPAGAGTWVFISSLSWASRDHPRGCGDMDVFRLYLRFVSGSPPRVRGHDKESAGPKRGDRITPAGAGTCHVPDRVIPVPPDHPRGCGDMKRSA